MYKIKNKTLLDANDVELAVFTEEGKEVAENVLKWLNSELKLGTPRAVKLITSDGYEALYVDGQLYDTGDTLGEGNPQVFWENIYDTYGINFFDVEEFYLEDADEAFLNGSFEPNLNSYLGNYGQ